MKGETMKLRFWQTIVQILHPLYWGAWKRMIKEDAKPRKGDFASRMAEAELDE